ncbi:type IV secretion system protein [Brevundimonas sp. A19_0]|uniref:type IV secretion system protein n=1 Tax=Brevundimonas sp. A19_0 TaxID=2821087 RepID=UPI001ADCB275|nr:type IV secretion system protein [Brevundimonas sp. A19_0]MBO9502484.1 type IV secretion system protein [Brevundimonas sp. A19_0]
MMTCPALSTGDAFLSSLLRHIDCQGQTVGAVGYQLLAAPGAPLTLFLTALLTLFVAFFGLRLMMGETPTLRSGVIAVAKIGVALAIATSWPAYRTVVYDVVVHGPAQLSTGLTGGTGLPVAGEALTRRLQAMDGSIGRLINVGSGRSDVTATTPPEDMRPGEAARRAPIDDDPALGAARVVFLSSTIAAYGVVSLTTGVLLALAPLFAGLILFDLSRGLVLGWARALVFAMLASVTMTVLLGVQLTLLEPWLERVLALRSERIVTAAAPVELLIVCLGFALALAGSFAVLLRLVFTSTASFTSWISAGASGLPQHVHAFAAGPTQSFPERPAPRAHALADALAASVRRERTVTTSGSGATARPSLRTTPMSPTLDDFAIPASAQTLRRTRPRKSLGAALRDRRS